jgi:hypothetical protein
MCAPRKPGSPERKNSAKASPFRYNLWEPLSTIQVPKPSREMTATGLLDITVRRIASSTLMKWQLLAVLSVPYVSRHSEPCQG